VRWIRSTTGYAVAVGGAGMLVPPSAAALPIAPGQLDGQIVLNLPSPMPAPFGTAMAVLVTTKGYFELLPAVPTSLPSVDFSPSVPELLDAASTRFACWHDFDQTATGSGAVTAEFAGNTLYLTWNGVFSYLSTLPNTCQFQLDLTTGDIRLVLQSMAGAATADPLLLGCSAAGFSPDPAAIDFSVAAPFEVRDLALPLRLLPVGWPQLGNLAFAVRTRHIPAIAPFAVVFVGDSAQNLPLSSIGMPGCAALSSANLASGAFAVSQNEGTWPLAIPSSPGLLGLLLHAQSVAFTEANLLGLLASDGLRIEIGN
jgi:hypothetical protein